MSTTGDSPVNRLPPPLSATGIGSLPHTQLEMAMQLAFRVDIPFLPTLPMKEPSELMIPQSVEGLPGVSFDSQGNTTVALARWELESKAFGHQLDRALQTMNVESFEPSATYASAWKPFLWEIEQRQCAFAKAQCTGPITARWVLKLDDGRPVSAVPELERQIFRLQLARALAMVRAIRERGARPIFFLDEPGLYALDPRDPGALVQMQELKLLVMSLQKEGALVGVHCCSNTVWPQVLGLGLDIVSLDARLSLGAVLSNGGAVSRFLDGGGRLALGIVPTNVNSADDTAGMIDETLARLRAPGHDALVGRVLSQALLTPACGLAMRTVADSEKTFEELRRAQEVLGRAARAAMH